MLPEWLSLHWYSVAGAILIIVTSLVAFAFKISSGRQTPSPPVSSREPPWLSWMLSGAALSLAVTSILAVFIPTLGFLLPYASSNFLRCTGLIIGASGTLLMSLSLKALGTNFSGSSGVRDNHELITRGPYRWIRNPYYTATWCITTGLALTLSSITLLLLGWLLFGLLAIRSIAEEKELEAHFPNAFSNWKRQTGRFLPNLSVLWK